MNRRKVLAVIGITMMYVLGGLDFVALDYLTRTISAEVVTFIRLVICAIILATIMLCKEKGIPIHKKDWPRLFLGGFLGMSLYYTFEAIGIAKLSASLASIILAVMPIFAMAGDLIFFKNPITLKKVAGIIVSIIGVSVVTFNGTLAGNLSGLLATLAAAICWVGYIIVIKPLNEQYSTINILTGLFISGAICGVPLFLAGGGIGQVAEFTPFQWLLIIGSGMFLLVIGQLCYVFAVGELSVTTVSIFGNLLPVTTVIFSFLILGQTLSLIQIIGGIMIIAAVTFIIHEEAVLK